MALIPDRLAQQPDPVPLRMTIDLANRNMVVSGDSKGIGLASAAAFGNVTGAIIAMAGGAQALI